MYVRTGMNPSDVLTKSIGSIKDRIVKVRMLLYDIYPESQDIEWMQVHLPDKMFLRGVFCL